MILASVQGLIYVFIIPPWEHYDEPTHFEYAWLIAYLNRLPDEGEYVQWMRRDLSASLFENNFFEKRNINVDFLSVNEPVWIGISQINDPPLYYLLISSLLHFVRFTDFTFQLYIARIGSLLMFLVTIFFVYKISLELFTEGHLLTKIIPIFIVFLPGFVDIMTSVNNDVGAIMFGTLFFWLAIRFLKNKQSVLSATMLVVVSIILLYTKNIGFLFIPILLITFIFGIKNNKYILFAFGLLSLAGLIFFINFLQFGGLPAFFSIQNYQELPLRMKSEDAQSGNYVFAIQRYENQNRRSNLVYYFNKNEISKMDSNEITIGGYVWSSSKIKTNIFNLYLNGELLKQITGEITEEKEFIYETVNFPGNVNELYLSMQPIKRENYTIYYDDVFIVSGSLNDYLNAQKPNLIRNGSAEYGWPILKQEVARKIDKKFPVSINHFVQILDLETNLDYYRATTKRLFRTFWAVFNWGGVFLWGRRPYFYLGLLTGISVIGSVIFGISKRKEISWRITILFLLSCLLIWGATFLRGFSSSFSGYTYIPVARYAYPVIFPTALILLSGLLFWVKLINTRVHLSNTMVTIIFLFSMIFLNIWSFFSIIAYFY